MTYKRKKVITIVLIAVLLFIIGCFQIGYKLPLGDRHKNWSTLEDYKSSSYIIQPSIIKSTLLNFGHRNRYLVLDQENKANVMDSTGRIIHVFDQSENILLDSLNNRILVPEYAKDKHPKTENKSAGIFDYISYNMETLAATPVKVINYELKESYDAFLKRKGITLSYDDMAAFNHQDSIYSAEYRIEREQDIRFFSKLSPVLAAQSNPLNVVYYTDHSGAVYNLVPNSKDNDQNAKRNFSASLYLLYPGSQSAQAIIDASYFSPDISSADHPAVTGNYIDFSFDLMIRPTGGAGPGIKLRFNQEYINYYQIKLKDSVLYFKAPDLIEAVFPTKGVKFFKQLSIPKSDQDTFAFFSEQQLYRVYPKHK